MAILHIWQANNYHGLYFKPGQSTGSIITDNESMSQMFERLCMDQSHLVFSNKPKIPVDPDYEPITGDSFKEIRDQ